MIYVQYVVYSFVQFCGLPDPWRSSQAQDLGEGHGRLLLFLQLHVLELLLQVAHHYVVVRVSLLSVVTLIYYDQCQICERNITK